MAGLERPVELRRARIEGPAEQRALLLGWEPIRPEALLAPPGAIALLAPERPVETLGGGDFDVSEYRVAYLRLIGPDGRFLDAFSQGQKAIPEDWLNCVEFRRVGALDGPDPEAGLDTLFEDKLKDPERLHAELAQLEANGLIRRAEEPVDLDPLLRGIFWGHYGRRARARRLDDQLRSLSLRGADIAELADLVELVRAQAFREGTAIGAGLQAAGLRDVLGPEIDASRELQSKSQDGNRKGNDTKQKIALAEERALYRGYLPRKAEIDGARPGNRADLVLGVFDPSELLDATKAELEQLIGYRPKIRRPWPSEDRVARMIRRWVAGHDPTRPQSTNWRAAKRSAEP